MNRKGIYSAVAGLIAILLVSMILVNANTAVQKEASADYGNEIVKLKSVAQNLRYLLDKAVAKAFYEGSDSINCSTIDDYTDKIEGKLDLLIDSFNSKTNLVCSYVLESLDVGNKIFSGQPFNVRMKCIKKIEILGKKEFEISYERVFSFKKEVSAILVPDVMGNDVCTISVKDAYSGLNEMP